MLFRLLFFSIMVMASMASLSQEPLKNYHQKIIPVSPNAAAIEKYIDYPISGHTGVPSISVPIYSCEIKGYTLPVSISYHAGGIKVDQDASNIGLGWALNAGGVITAKVNGITDDFSGMGNSHPQYQKIKNLSFVTSYGPTYMDCFNLELLDDPFIIYTGEDIEYLRNVISYNDDSQPDIYSFQYGARSGQFFKDENGVFRTIPFSKLKIETYSALNFSGFVIIDEEGVRFEFTEISGSKGVEANSLNPLYGKDAIYSNYRPSYSLTKIQTPNGGEMNFTYAHQNYNNLMQIQANRDKYLVPESGCFQYYNGDMKYRYTSSTMEMRYNDKVISSISTNNGLEVVFEYDSEPRLDLPGNGSTMTGARALKSIAMLRPGTEPEQIKKINFSHNYFSTGGGMASMYNYRLRLDALQEEGKPPYQFFYNTTPLPHRLSFAQDHWGYSNGKFTNTSLFPKDIAHLLLDGADREPDFEHTQAGVLSKIIYPTGGFVEYTYEPNNYRVIANTNKYTEYIGPGVIYQPNNTQSETFSIPEGAIAIRIFYNNAFTGTEVHNDETYIYLDGPNNYHLVMTGVNNEGQLLSLEPGEYTLSITAVGDTYPASASIRWYNTEVQPPHNKITGGLRIKKIKAYSANNTVSYIKSFEYLKPGTDESSGIVMFEPAYIQYNISDFFVPNTGCGGNCGFIQCSYLSQNNNSYLPLFFENGSVVGYTDLTEYAADNDGPDKYTNGYKESKYIVNNNYDLSYTPNFPYVPQILFNWMNGALLSEKVYSKRSDGTTNLAKQITNTYNYNFFDNGMENLPNTFKALGAKIGLLKGMDICRSGCDCTIPNAIFSQIQFGVAGFKIYSSWHYLTSQTVTEYDINDNVLTQVYSYDYNHDNILPQATERTNSKLELIRKEFKYPGDFAANPVYAEMLARNMIAPVIEETEWNTNVITEKTELVYAINPVTNVPLPSELIRYDPPTSLAQSLKKFQVYDHNNNLVQETQSDGITKVYTWGYAGSYPVAETRNALLNEVAFTSFEPGTDSRWTGIQPGAIHAVTGGGSSITGNHFYTLTGNPLTSEALPTGKTYTVSYWSSNGAYDVNGTVYRQGKTITVNNVQWTCYEHQVIVDNPISISGTGNIDELRLYPSAAQMTTFTYKPFTGLTSQCDMNNRITYFEYDSLSRLMMVKDEDGNILKKFEYQYYE
ncbi:MAG TPA: hypothetical protein PKC39_15560 [Ferruginibacter sp.]|nr:hypothetical protein [Ferruginibacter sp.]HMP22376.1 hypothetical protein [Ferruginibacter sp.]